MLTMVESKFPSKFSGYNCGNMLDPYSLPLCLQS